MGDEAPPPARGAAAAPWGRPAWRVAPPQPVARGAGQGRAGQAAPCGAATGAGPLRRWARPPWRSSHHHRSPTAGPRGRRGRQSRARPPPCAAAPSPRCTTTAPTPSSGEGPSSHPPPATGPAHPHTHTRAGDPRARGRGEPRLDTQQCVCACVCAHGPARMTLVSL